MGKCCHESDVARVQGGVQGHVRSWVDWPEAGLLLLNMRGNRWCGNIGRAHKSNGIFYVVDLQACRVPTRHVQRAKHLSHRQA